MASSSSGNAQPPSEEQLPRGKACVYCRRRKMRCDGVRPTCGPCLRGNRPDDCEYTDGQGRPKTYILEEDIARLEARIHELENPVETDAPVTLFNPYRTPAAAVAPTSTSPIPLRPPENVAPSYDSWWTAPDIPRHLAETLVDNFLPHASEFGFFLQPERYRSSVLLGEPIGHPSRPLPALINVVYLWGIRVSREPSLHVHEGAILRRTLDQISTALAGSHPNRVLHVLQAHVLLAVYFLSNGRFLEGKYHITSAVSLAVSSGLHKIRSTQHSVSVTLLPPPNGPIEEGERIRAFWTVFTLDESWAVAFNVSPNMTWITNDPAAQVDSPWPEEPDVYEQRTEVPTDLDSLTLQKFIQDTNAYYGSSALALQAQAAALWEQTFRLINGWKPDLSPQETTTFSDSFNSLDQCIQRLRSTQMPAEHMHGLPPAAVRALVVAYSIAHAATIQLYSIFPSDAGAQQTSVRAGLSIASLIGHAPLVESTYINPIMGTVWVAACQVLIREIARLQVLRLAGADNVVEEQQVQSTLIFGFGAMSTFANTVPLMKFQLDKIQEAYASL